jgi:DNA-binding GntR family transcriptional regulator
MSESPSTSLADRAFQLIESQIVTLVLPPGSRTTEQRLAQATGLGRTPVREALLRLAQGFLVEVRPRQGVLIRPIEVELIHQTLAVRGRVERLIVERAASFADAGERRVLAALANDFKSAVREEDAVAFAAADAALNELLNRAARHEVAAKLVEPLHCVSRRAGFVHSSLSSGGMSRTGPGHLRLINAVVAGDAPAAAAALDGLLDLTAVIADQLAGKLSTRPRSPSASRPELCR